MVNFLFVGEVWLNPNFLTLEARHAPNFFMEMQTDNPTQQLGISHQPSFPPASALSAESRGGVASPMAPKARKVRARQRTELKDEPWIF